MSILRRRRVKIVLLGISAALAVTACSSSSGSSGGAGGSSPSSVAATQSLAAGPKPSGTSITIGVISDQTGPNAQNYNEGVPQVAQAWADWINATQGGLKGHPVKVVTEDTQSVPGTAAGEARQLVEQDHAVAIVAMSSYAATMYTYLAGQKIPLIGGDGGARSPGDNLWFPVDAAGAGIFEGPAVVAKDSGAKSIAGAVCSESAACQQIAGALKSYAPTIGLAYKGSVSMSNSATTATAQCLEFAGSGADSVAVYLGLNAASLIVSDCRSQGYKGSFIQLAPVDKTFQTLNAQMLSLNRGFPWWSTAAPVVQYRSVMAAYQPSADYESSQASETWASLQILSYAMDKSGPAASAAVTGPDVITALQTAVKGVTLDGILPQPITYSASGDTVINCFWATQYSPGGKYTTLPSPNSGNGAKGDLASQCIG